MNNNQIVIKMCEKRLEEIRLEEIDLGHEKIDLEDSIERIYNNENTKSRI